MFEIHRVLVVAAAAAFLIPGCGDDDDDGGTPAGTGGSRPEGTGAFCEAPSDCFPDVAEGEIDGEILCLDRVEDGYCTHECEVDDDCCAAEGECEEGLHQVCSPFESTGERMCFVSCEPEDLDAAGEDDEGTYCQKRASPDFICRSSGGGSENRKVCVPGDCGGGADCQSDADCTGGLECNTTFSGGYCGARECETNDDCPGDMACVEGASGPNLCLKRCSTQSDCSFCRANGTTTTCSDDVLFAEADDSGSVCVP